MSDFSADERSTMAALVDLIIPASDEFAVPSAADPAILDEILSDAQRHRQRIGAALVALDAIAQDHHGADFAALEPADQTAAAEAFRSAHDGDAALIANLTSQCYYRDDRVMQSIGMEPRPPHPQGYEVEQGDWSLLDPVRNRTALYRKTGSA